VGPSSPLHETALPGVADRGDGLQIWRAAANILNKHLRTADSGWSARLVILRGAKSSHRKKIIYEILHRASDGFFGTT
jgi:hypothetical protein